MKKRQFIKDPYLKVRYSYVGIEHMVRYLPNEYEQMDYKKVLPKIIVEKIDNEEEK